jgi:hypothetical protein
MERRGEEVVAILVSPYYVHTKSRGEEIVAGWSANQK